MTSSADETQGNSTSGHSPASALDALIPQYVLPHEIKAHLDKFVVGQEPAKTELSTLMSMHLLLAREPDRKFQTPNALLVGPTGVGKTHSIRTVADYLRLPFVNGDATKLLPSGARAETGEHLDVLLGELLDAAQEIVNKIERNVRGEIAEILRNDYGYGGRSDLRQDNELLTIALAERGIIFLDEFDKLSFGGAEINTHWFRSVQSGLLKLVEGSGNPLGHVSDFPSVNTSNMLFIGGGAFADFTDLGSRRGSSGSPPLTISSFSLGINQRSSADLMTYGFLPELIGRFPILINYAALTTEDLRQILGSSSVDPLRSFIYYFEKNGKRLVVTDEALEVIAGRANALKMGARGIHQVIFPQIAKAAYSFFQQSDETVYELTADAVNQYHRA